MKLATLLMLLASGPICERPKPVYKATKLSLTELAIYCQNGADPTGRKIGNTLIVSCGK